MLVLSAVLGCLLPIPVLATTIGSTQKFFDHVLANYSSEIPVWDVTTEVLLLNFRIPFVVLANLEENQQLASYIAKVVVSWTDPRLQYDPVFIGDDGIMVPSTRVWIPAFEVYNSMEVQASDRPQSFYEAKIRPNGTVSILWAARFDTVCQLTMDNFPFDHQWCPISFSCGSYSASKVQAHATVAASDFLVGNPEFQIVTQGTRDLYHGTDRTTNQSLTRISYYLARNPEFYIYFLILPTYLITTTCLVALLFPLKMEIGEKMNLCLAGLLGLTFMLSVIVQELPRTARIPLMGKWLLIQMCFCILGLAADFPLAVLKSRYRKEPQKYKFWSILILVVIMLTHCLTSILLFVILPAEPAPSTYQTI